MSLKFIPAIFTCSSMQEAARAPLLAPAPGPLPHGAAPGQHLAGNIPVILSNTKGMQVHVLPIGATIQRLLVPNDQGVAEDVVLGFDDPAQYKVEIWHTTLTSLAVLHTTISLNGIELLLLSGGSCCRAQLHSGRQL